MSLLQMHQKKALEESEFHLYQLQNKKYELEKELKETTDPALRENLTMSINDYKYSIHCTQERIEGLKKSLQEVVL